METFHRWQKLSKFVQEYSKKWRYLRRLLRFCVAFLCGFLLVINSLTVSATGLNFGTNSSFEQMASKPPLSFHGLMSLQGPRLNLITISHPLNIKSGEDLTLKGQERTKNEAKANGLTYYQEGRYQEAIKIWEANLETTTTPLVKITLRSNLALAYRQIGQVSQAIDQWQSALELLNQLPVGDRGFDKVRQTAAVLTEQGQLYSEMGQHQSAITVLEKALEMTQKPEYGQNLEYLVIAAAAQGSLGHAYGAVGNFDKAQTTLEAALAKVKQLEAQNHPQSKLFRISTQNHLGNLLSKRSLRLALQMKNARSEGDIPLAEELLQKSEQDNQTALGLYEDNVNVSAGVGGSVEVQALLNYSRVLFSNSRPSLDTVAQAHRYHTKIQQVLAGLPSSRDKVYHLIALAENIHLWQNDSSREGHQHSHQDVINILETAVGIAQKIGDTRGESFAWGSLGLISKTESKYNLAVEQTRRAMFLSQAAAAPDSLYRWQWQLGQILRAQQQYPAAIIAYEQAIASLQTIRADIIAANKEVQFNFRDSVEPVYRELIDLLLMPPNDSGVAANLKSDPKADPKSDLKLEPTEPTAKITQVTSLAAQGVPLQNIRRTLDILELLKLAELQNFFGDDCVQVESDRFDSGSKANFKSALKEDTAIVYNILLDNRTEIILRSSKDTLRLYHVPVGAAAIQKEVNQLRGFLEKRSTDEYLPQVQKLYKLLIEPMEGDLAALQPKTLVFVNDGVLRKIPMAALHDSEKFLIQKYAIATTPSLSLTSTKGLDRHNLRALILGLTVERAPFAALPNVEIELNTVADIVKGTKLLDAEFTVSELDKILRNESYPIVHMATHGRFGIDAETTFLQTYDGRMGINQLDDLLRSRRGQQAVDLLTLSACQTAVGDDRSALGIAGVAVRAGVRSALASLWFINDQATVPLIRAFYENLSKENLSKAQALQEAQIKMIQNPDLNHPAVWSSFILIGNWF
jgi:CHAT domain-containing protein